jgi:sarcosine oxidase subunit alpha
VSGPPQPLPPGRWTDPARPLTFTFNRRTIPAVAGQSIAAALYAAGIRVFSRSFKYHRPRGLFCLTGDCPNCLMNVDGRPNVRTCIEPVRDGQVVCGQNAWPSLRWDVLRVFDWLHAWLPVGFYYKRFHKPRWLWPVFEYVVRRIAGLGRIDTRSMPAVAASVEHLHTEVCVVGGGPAGMAAALGAAEAGARVLLLERQPELGGHLLDESPDHSARIETQISALTKEQRVQILLQTSVFGIYEGSLLAAVCGDRLFKIRSRQIVVCTGARQQPEVFHNNDLPGIFLSRGVQRLARLYGVRAGHRTVVYGGGQTARQLSQDLTDLGIDLVAHLLPPGDALAAADRPDHPVWENATLVKAYGHGRLQGVRITMGTVAVSASTHIPCDLLCLATPPVPANELLLQAGMRFHQVQGRWQPDGEIQGVRAAGGVAGTSAKAHALEGRLRGLEAAAAVGHVSPALEECRRQWQAAASESEPLVVATPEQSSLPKRFICFCEDVTHKDLLNAVAEGFDHIETLKRYSTATMGPCQGKMCGLALRAVCALATGRTSAHTGSTTARPPARPIDLAVLAADRFRPVRRTPLHHWHQAASARWLDASGWKRPESYGDPTAEVSAVRNGVGLIDVSTLAKIEVFGPDAAELLERIYLNHWSDLKPGRARYGVMCNEDGILFDDGVGARLGSERYYLTATTGNAEAVVQWLELWRTTWRQNATVISRTSALAAMNLAGPRAREVLSQAAALDLSPAAFPYMSVREAEVAGVPCRLLRIGFVGELGYEIHCPSGHAWTVWHTLCEAGEEFGLKPFGVEAQRVLRLEKGHLIIGQDSDALSTPLEAGLDWLVAFDKPSFHGREPLNRLRERGPRSRLIGFTAVQEDWVPEEGCQVVEENQPVGRVTSARFSPTLQRSLGLAWVPARLNVGDQFFIRCHEADVPAIVAPLPFYDPEGKRVKA